MSGSVFFWYVFPVLAAVVVWAAILLLGKGKPDDKFHADE